MYIVPLKSNIILSMSFSTVFIFILNVIVNTNITLLVPFGKICLLSTQLRTYCSSSFCTFLEILSISPLRRSFRSLGLWTTQTFYLSSGHTTHSFLSYCTLLFPIVPGLLSPEISVILYPICSFSECIRKNYRSFYRVLQDIV